MSINNTQRQQNATKLPRSLGFEDLCSIKKIQDSLKTEYKYFNSFDEFRDIFNAIESADFKAKYSAEFKRVYQLLIGIFKDFVLMPNTICVFDIVFRRYLKQQFEKLLKKKDNSNTKSQEWQSIAPASSLFTYQTSQEDLLSQLFPSAIICLRLVIKHVEVQAHFYKPNQKFMKNDRPSSSFQRLLDLISMSIIEKKETIFKEADRVSHPSKEQLSRSQFPLEIYYQINEFIQQTEFDILNANDWNLKVFSACQTLELCLNLANNKFDFLNIVSLVETQVIDLITVRSISDDIFLKPFRHSSLIFGVLRMFLKRKQCDTFEKEFYGQFMTQLHLKSHAYFLNQEQMVQTEARINQFVQDDFMRRISSQGQGQDNLDNQSTEQGNSEQGAEDQHDQLQQLQAIDFDDSQSYKSAAYFQEKPYADDLTQIPQMADQGEKKSLVVTKQSKKQKSTQKPRNVSMKKTIKKSTSPSDLQSKVSLKSKCIRKSTMKPAKSQH